MSVNTLELLSMWETWITEFILLNFTFLLLQISTRSEDFLVDTLALRSYLHVLNTSFTNPNILKVWYGIVKSSLKLSHLHAYNTQTEKLRINFIHLLRPIFANVHIMTFIGIARGWQWYCMAAARFWALHRQHVRHWTGKLIAQYQIIIHKDMEYKCKALSLEFVVIFIIHSQEWS